MQKIPVLFTITNGTYFNDPRFDPWDIERDATKYEGTLPVIAHPPCQLWGALAFVNYARWGGEHNKPYNDGGLFKFALDTVRRVGGVIEHPAKSHAFKVYGLGKPEKGKWIRSEDGVGYICEVWQSAYGHLANKATWLYYVGKYPPFDLIWYRPKGTHQIGGKNKEGKGKPTLNKFHANSTPDRFKTVLYSLVMQSDKDEWTPEPNPLGNCPECGSEDGLSIDSSWELQLSTISCIDCRYSFQDSVCEEDLIKRLKGI